MKTQIVLPDELAEKFKRMIPARKRSAFIAETLERELKMINCREAIRSSAGVWTDKTHPELAVKDGVERYLSRFRGRLGQRG